jgi:hypothetical protein
VSQTVLIILSTAGTDVGPFDLYSDVDGYTSSFATGISKTVLLSGYSCTTVPDGTTIIKVQSYGTCTNYILLTISGTTTTTTSTSSTTSTTTTTTTTTTATPTTTSTTTVVNYTVDVYAKSSDVDAAWFYQIQYSLDGGGTWTNIGNTFRTVLCTNLSSTVTVPSGSNITFQVVDDQFPSPGYLYQFGMTTNSTCPSSGGLCSSVGYTVTGNIDRAFWVNTDFTLC